LTRRDLCSTILTDAGHFVIRIDRRESDPI